MVAEANKNGPEMYHEYTASVDAKIIDPELVDDAKGQEIAALPPTESVPISIKDIVFDVQNHFNRSPDKPLSRTDAITLRNVSRYLKRTYEGLKITNDPYRRIEKKALLQNQAINLEREKQFIALSFFVSELIRHNEDILTAQSAPSPTKPENPQLPPVEQQQQMNLDEAWKKNFSEHGERAEMLKNELENVEKQTITLESTVTAFGTHIDDTDYANVNSEIANVNTICVALSAGPQERLVSLYRQAATNGITVQAIELNTQKAEFLQGTYVGKLLSLKERLKKADFTLWEKKVQDTVQPLHPEFKELRDSIARVEPTVVGRAPTTALRELTLWWEGLERAIRDLQNLGDASYANPEEAEKKAFLQQNLDQGSLVLVERGNKLKTYWEVEAHLFVFYPDLQPLQVKTAENISTKVTADLINDLAVINRYISGITAAFYASGIPTIFHADFFLVLQNGYFTPALAHNTAIDTRLQEMQQQLSTFDALNLEVQKLDAQRFDFDREVDTVNPVFTKLMDRFDREKHLLSRDQQIEMETQILRSQYRHLRQAMYSSLQKVENVNMGFGPAINMFDAVEIYALRSMERIHVQLDQLNYREKDRYKEDLVRLRRSFQARRLLQLSWATLFASIIDSKDHTPIANPMNDTIPLSGGNIEELINDGIMDPFFDEVDSATGRVTNRLNERVGHGPRRDEMKDWTTFGATRMERFNETAMGRCMRILDEVYSGTKTPPYIASDGAKISTGNLQAYSSDLITQIAADQRIDPSIVQRAFRLHAITTLNQAFLSPGSPGVTDYYYYMFHWLDYVVKYQEQGTSSFSPLLTYLLFGLKEVDTFGNLYPGKTQAIIDAFKALPKHDLLTSNPQRLARLKFGTYKFLSKPPLFNLRNVAFGTDRRTGAPNYNLPVFTNPLRYWIIRDNTGQAKRNPSAGPGKVGTMLTFDDYKNTDNEYLYEMMPWDQLPDAPILSYYQQLGNHPYDFLNEVLKKPANQLWSEMENADNVAKFKKVIGFAADFCPIVGDEIRGGNQDSQDIKDLKDAVRNQMTLMLIFAFCLARIDVSLSGERRWPLTKLTEYLDSLVTANVITDEERVALEEATRAGSLRDIFLADFSNSVQKQLARQLTIVNER